MCTFKVILKGEKLLQILIDYDYMGLLSSPTTSVQMYVFRKNSEFMQFLCVLLDDLCDLDAHFQSQI